MERYYLLYCTKVVCLNSSLYWTTRSFSALKESKWLYAAPFETTLKDDNYLAKQTQRKRSYAELSAFLTNHAGLVISIISDWGAKTCISKWEYGCTRWPHLYHIFISVTWERGKKLSGTQGIGGSFPCRRSLARHAIFRRNAWRNPKNVCVEGGDGGWNRNKKSSFPPPPLLRASFMGWVFWTASVEHDIFYKVVVIILMK